MKKLLVGILVLTSVSSFANSGVKYFCDVESSIRNSVTGISALSGELSVSTQEQSKSASLYVSFNETLTFKLSKVEENGDLNFSIIRNKNNKVLSSTNLMSAADEFNVSANYSKSLGKKKVLAKCTITNLK